ncbi:MAG: VIT domain-containing protein, partial [Planctomycetota bacterium]
MKKMTWLNTCSAVAAVAAVTLYALVGCMNESRESYRVAPSSASTTSGARPLPTVPIELNNLSGLMPAAEPALDGADTGVYSVGQVPRLGDIPVVGEVFVSGNDIDGRMVRRQVAAGERELEQLSLAKPAEAKSRAVGPRPVGAVRSKAGGGNGEVAKDSKPVGVPEGKPEAKGDDVGGWKERGEMDAVAYRKALVDRPEPRFDEELWVISKAERDTDEFKERQLRGAVVENDDRPGSGGLVCVVPSPGRVPQQVAIPLKHTDVRASVSGFISQVSVTQQFQNPYSEKIEAVYVFPLPEDAAVNDFVMKVGDRTIRGIIRERGEAERIYAAAREQGYVASLLTQERPNIFTQKVANIEPGKSIDISITYFNTLAYRDGAFEFVFPMVVGPRFNPPASEGERAIGMRK